MGKTTDPSTSKACCVGFAVVSSCWKDRPILYTNTHILYTYHFTNKNNCILIYQCIILLALK